MKRKQFLSDLRGLSSADLQARALSLGEELMKLRFRKATGQLDQSHRLGETKRNLARAVGELRQRATAADAGSSKAE